MAVLTCDCLVHVLWPARMAGQTIAPKYLPGGLHVVLYGKLFSVINLHDDTDQVPVLHTFESKDAALMCAQVYATAGVRIWV